MVDRVSGIGIDVGADRLHIVGLRSDASLALATVIDPSQLDEVRDLLASFAPCSVAIDGPGGSSNAPFAGDLTVSTKFRKARGCEVTLGREYGIWVSFATGEAPLTGWMAVAAAVHELAETAGHIPLETYPHAAYHLLHGARPPKKTSAAGILARVESLQKRGLTEPTLALWSHDALDAAAAAIVALDHASGTARRAYCLTDDTSVWLPKL